MGREAKRWPGFTAGAQRSGFILSKPEIVIVETAEKTIQDGLGFSFLVFFSVEVK